MSFKVLIIPDKFKGTLTAQAAAAAIARGWRSARPKDSVELLPMSDGGDGFGEVTSRLLGATSQPISTIDAAHRRCRVQWWWEVGTSTAIIESAGVIGLAMLPPKRYHPFELDTFGLGRVIQAAADKGAKRILIGIGGSATNDGGFGLARALGWTFLDKAGTEIKRWTDLTALTELLPPASELQFKSLVVAVDVQNPLLGSRGASRVYGPQKGLSPQDFRWAESCLRQLAAIVKRTLHRDYGKIPGAGAAGGLGFGLMAFLKATPRAGFDLFQRVAKLETRLRTADLVITGEGAIDKSTLMGKGVGEVARRCRQLRVPCLGLAGVVRDATSVKKLFTAVHGLTEVTTSSKAQANAAGWLTRLAAGVAQRWR